MSESNLENLNRLERIQRRIEELKIDLDGLAGDGKTLSDPQDISNFRSLSEELRDYEQMERELVSKGS